MTWCGARMYYTAHIGHSVFHRVSRFSVYRMIVYKPHYIINTSNKAASNDCFKNTYSSVCSLFSCHIGKTLREKKKHCLFTQPLDNKVFFKDLIGGSQRKQTHSFSLCAAQLRLLNKCSVKKKRNVIIRASNSHTRFCKH